MENKNDHFISAHDALMNAGFTGDKILAILTAIDLMTTKHQSMEEFGKEWDKQIRKERREKFVMWFGFCIMWLVTASLIRVAIAVSGHWAPLFFLLIPAIAGYPNEEKRKKEEKEDAKDGTDGTDTLSVR